VSKRRLGKGIDALLQGRDLGQLETELNAVVSVPIAQLKPNPNQPRKNFPTETLQELARSIEEKGIIQPILAEQQPDRTYVIVAGERRFRAAQMAGLTVVPVLPGSFSAEEKLEIALIENVQREDLNPIEEAQAYRELMTSAGFSQEELATHLGRSRPAIANSLRLLRLPESVRGHVVSGALSAGHARSLLTVRDAERLEALATLVMEHDLSVRRTERAAAAVESGFEPHVAVERLLDQERSGEQTTEPLLPFGAAGGSEATDAAGTDENGATGTDDREKHTESAGGAPRKTVEMQQIEDQLIEVLGTKVQLAGTNRQGRIEIRYYSMEDLERVVELIAGSTGTT
jgi:ParB family chromosome partitioning protein